MKFRNPFQGLTTFEWGLWIGSVAVVLIAKTTYLIVG